MNTVNADVEYSGYTNPLNPQTDNADPCIVYCNKTKYYYGIYTGGTSLRLHRAKKLGDLFSNDESEIIYRANEADDTYGFLWAPELHYIDGWWYLYTSTHQTATNRYLKHVICLKAKSEDLLEGFEFAAHINKELFAIDPTIYQDRKNQKLYICFSAMIDGEQKLAIQELKNPTEPIGDYTVIASAKYDWELVPPYDKMKINEGAYFIENQGRLFIVYSGNGCWSDDYILGVLEFVGTDMLSADAWVKHPEPVMTKGNGNYGPGHATFFYSPDQSELWIAHHCLHDTNPSCDVMVRHCHAQKVLFDQSGFPIMDKPLPKNTVFPAPSGE
jgi:GH43 family beta-xylosidase